MFFLKKLLLILTLCFIAFFITVPEAALSKSGQGDTGGYKQLIRVFEKYLYLENKAVKQLTFKLSPVQSIKTGACLKFILLDDLGREWIFKPFFHGNSRSSIIVSRLFKLFGLESPVVHPIALNINGKSVYGGIQRFIPNTGTLSNFPPERLSSSGCNYLIKTHIFYWLFDNYDANPSNFIILSLNDDGKAENIARIDNEIAFIFLDRDKLRDVHKKMAGTYYYSLWEAYTLKKIDLDLREAYVFAGFVEEFPDWFIAELIKPLIIKGSDELANAAFYDRSIDKSCLLETLILRKRNLSNDLAEFYRDLAAKRGDSLALSKEVPYQKFIEQSRADLVNRINQLKREISSIKKKDMPAKASEFKAVFSFEGYKLLDRVYMNYWAKKSKDLAAECDYALRQFSQLESSAANKCEKRALKLYRQEVEKISQGAKPSFSYRNINKLVDIVPDGDLM